MFRKILPILLAIFPPRRFAARRLLAIFPPRRFAARRLLAIFSCIMANSAIAETLQQKADDVFLAIEQFSGKQPEFIFDGKPCDKGYCFAMLGPTQVSVYGLGIVKVETTTQWSWDEYISVCAAAYAGLSGANPQFSKDLMLHAFQEAYYTGSFKQWIENTEVTVTPDLSNLLMCRFFRN